MKRTIKNILLFLRIPLRNYREDKQIDEWFRKQLENPKFEYINDGYYLNTASIKLNGVEIWIANKFYASPSIHNDETLDTLLPYKDTTLLFFKKLNEFLNKDNKNLKDKLSKLGI